MAITLSPAAAGLYILPDHDTRARECHLVAAGFLSETAAHGGTGDPCTGQGGLAYMKQAAVSFGSSTPGRELPVREAGRGCVWFGGERQWS